MNNTTNIDYTGWVVIDTNKNPPVKRKNNGSRLLFKLLYDILAEKILDVSDNILEHDTLVERLPTFITIVGLDSKGSPESTRESQDKDMSNGILRGEAVLLHEIPIQRRDIEYLTDSDGKTYAHNVKFDALLYNSNVYNAKSSIDYDYHIVLLDGTSERNVLAFMQIKLTDFEAVYENTDSQAKLTWYMTFGNSDKGESNT